MPWSDVVKYFQVADELVAEFTDPSSSLASPDQVKTKVKLFLINEICTISIYVTGKVKLYLLILLF